MPIRVLVVEDSAAMRTFVSSVLESAGEYDVHEVSHGFDAMRLLPRGDYALIITDINMPDINGLELIRAVRDSPRHANTPVLVVTTEGRPADVERARAAGAQAVLIKPFTRAELLDAVRGAQSGAEVGPA